MKINDLETRKNYKEYLSQAAPEIGDILPYLDDPMKSSKTRSCLVPWASETDGNKSTYSMELFVFVVDSNYEKITERMDLLASKIKQAVYGGEAPADGIVNIDHIVPAPGSPNIGTLRAVIKLDIDYIDDCR